MPPRKYDGRVLLPYTPHVTAGDSLGFDKSMIKTLRKSLPSVLAKQETITRPKISHPIGNVSSPGLEQKRHSNWVLFGIFPSPIQEMSSAVF